MGEIVCAPEQANKTESQLTTRATRLSAAIIPGSDIRAMKNVKERQTEEIKLADFFTLVDAPLFDSPYSSLKIAAQREELGEKSKRIFEV